MNWIQLIAAFLPSAFLHRVSSQNRSHLAGETLRAGFPATNLCNSHSKPQSLPEGKHSRAARQLADFHQPRGQGGFSPSDRMGVIWIYPWWVQTSFSVEKAFFSSGFSVICPLPAVHGLASSYQYKQFWSGVTSENVRCLFPKAKDRGQWVGQRATW